MLRLLRALDAFPRERAPFAQLHREGWGVAISTVMAAERRGLVTRGEQWIRLTDAGRAVVAAYAQGYHQAGIDRQAFRGDDMAVYVGPSDVHIVEELPDTDEGDVQ